MSARTWQSWSDGGVFCRADEVDEGPAIRTYAYPVGDEWMWEVNAEAPSGAITMIRGRADNETDAKVLAVAALARIVDGGPSLGEAQ